jgi:hypothetical protein
MFRNPSDDIPFAQNLCLGARFSLCIKRFFLAWNLCSVAP